MGVNAKIFDATGGRNGLRIDSDGTANVVVHPHPPKMEELRTLPFAQFFTSDGTSTGSNDMIVNATLANTSDFYIKSDPVYDLYINRVTIQISDPGASLTKFGALTALTNGVQWFFKNSEVGTLTLSTAWKTNLDIFRDATHGKEFGDTSPWLVDIAGGAGEDTYFPVIDIEEAFGVQWGLLLKKNSDDRLGFSVRDNLTGLTVFNIKGYGIRF